MEIYTPEEVAEKLKLNVNTVWRYIKDGKLQAAKFGNRYRISEDQLREFFERMSTEASGADAQDPQE
jgi:excisionase family DNA binding protein